MSEIKAGPLAWMAGHSVAANLIMLICVVGGFLALGTIKQEVMPEFEIESVSIRVAYPGASPEEVEDGVILVVEEAVRGLDGVDEINSVAGEGSGTVTVDVLAGADLQRLAQDIQSEVDRIRTFPEEAEEPQVSIASFRHGVLTLVIYGDAPMRALQHLGEEVRDELLQDPDITQVEVSGLPDLEISVEVPQENLRRYGLTLGEIARRVRAASINMGGGGLDTESGEILLRVQERRDYGEEFAELPVIAAEGGGEVLLRQVGSVEDGFAQSDRYALFNGMPAVMLDIYRVGEQTPIQVADAIGRHMDDIAGLLPAGIETDIVYDRSEVYRERAELLIKNGALGLVLVLCVLGLFLEARLAFWVMMGIPISFLGSFLFLPVVGVSINMVSLFAYIIALGIVVDDAIVVGENVYHYRQEGLPFHIAAVKGAREVVMPVTFSILTNIAAFLPIYFIPGVMGNLFKTIPVVVTVIFLISLGECLFVLPAHLSHARKSRRRGAAGWLHERQQGFSHAFRRWTRLRYGPFLEFALRHRYVTLASAASLLMLVAAYAASGRMGFQIFPVVESHFAQASVTLPYGAPIERTEEIMHRLYDGAAGVIEESGHPELVTAVIADVGRGGSHAGRMRVMMAEAEVRDRVMSTAEFTRRWREAVGEVTGVESLMFVSDAGGPGSHGRAIAVELSHRDIDVLESASSELAEVIATYPRVKDVDDGFQPGKPQLDFTIKTEGKSLGLTAEEVARQVRNAFYGAEALRQQRGRNEVKVMVRLPENERDSEHAIDRLMLKTPAGTFVPLKDVAAVTRGRAYKTIDRRNGRRVVQVSADIAQRAKAGEVLEGLQAGELQAIVRNHPGLQYSFEGHQADIRESMGSLQVTFVLALMAIYAMLAIPFRSYIQPLIVMTSIPFGIIGAFIGHLIMGYDLCLPSMFGIVALCGIVVNDSLILIDFANRARRGNGASAHDAIHAAAIQRMRPVLLTTFTTFAGLGPMIFETSRQARFLVPMALSLGFGILFATFITLLLVPSLYIAIEDIKGAAAFLGGALRRPGARRRPRAVEEGESPQV